MIEECYSVFTYTLKNTQIESHNRILLFGVFLHFGEFIVVEKSRLGQE